MTIKTVIGEITANENTMLSISIAFGETAHLYEKLGLTAMGLEAREVHNQIHHELDAIGYYTINE